jgi:hypothetical protein
MAYKGTAKSWQEDPAATPRLRFPEARQFQSVRRALDEQEGAPNHSLSPSARF